MQKRTSSQLFNVCKAGLALFFLDEIQNVFDCVRFVRRIYNTLNLPFFVTGSSSELLSLEIATSLPGSI